MNPRSLLVMLLFTFGFSSNNFAEEPEEVPEPVRSYPNGYQAIMLLSKALLMPGGGHLCLWSGSIQNN